jgi:hypothetical protein
MDRTEFAKAVWYTANIYCARELTDGRLTPSAQVIVFAQAGPKAFAAKDAVTNELIDAVLWERRGPDIWVHDYLDYNPSREQVLNERKKRSDAGKKGGQRSVETREERYGSTQPKRVIEANAEASASRTASSICPNPGPGPGPIPEPRSPSSGGSSNPGNDGSPTPRKNPRSSALASAGSKPEGKPERKTEENTTKIWERYAAAYHRRWGVEPVRNAETNAHLCRLVKLVGQTDALEMAPFYVTLNKRWYVDHQHDLKYLASDAQSIRTQWMTGRTVTSRQATETDRLQGTADMVRRLEERAEGRRNGV